MLEGFDRFGADGKEGKIYDISVLNGKWVYQDEVTVKNGNTVSGYVHSSRREGEGVRNRNMNDWLLNSCVVYLKNERYHVYFKAPVLYKEAFNSSTGQYIPIKDGHRVYKLRRVNVTKDYSNKTITYSYVNLTHHDVNFIETNPWAFVPKQIKDYLGFEVSGSPKKVERSGWDGTNLYVQTAGMLHGSNNKRITFLPSQSSDLDGRDSVIIRNFGDLDGKYVYNVDEGYFDNDNFDNYYYIKRVNESWQIREYFMNPLVEHETVLVLEGWDENEYNKRVLLKDITKNWASSKASNFPNASIENRALRIYEITHQTQLQTINSNIPAYFSNLAEFTLSSHEDSDALIYETVSANRFSSITRLFFYIMTEGLGEKGKHDNVIDRATDRDIERILVEKSRAAEIAQDIFTKATTTINFFGPLGELMQMNLSVDGIGRHLDEPKAALVVLDLLVFQTATELTVTVISGVDDQKKIDFGGTYQVDLSSGEFHQRKNSIGTKVSDILFPLKTMTDYDGDKSNMCKFIITENKQLVFKASPKYTNEEKQYTRGFMKYFWNEPPNFHIIPNLKGISSTRFASFNSNLFSRPIRDSLLWKTESNIGSCGFFKQDMKKVTVLY